MVNQGRIHRKLGKFLMISSNFIKSDNESLIKNWGFGYFQKENLKTILRNQKSMNLILISQRNQRLIRGEIFITLKSRKQKLREKLN